MLHDAGGGHVQSHRGVHQPGPIQVDADPMAPGQELHLGAKSRQRSEGLSLGPEWREDQSPGAWRSPDGSGLGRCPAWPPRTGAGAQLPEPGRRPL